MIHTDLSLSSFLPVMVGGLSRTFQADIPRAPWPSWEPRTRRPPSTHLISKAAFHLSLSNAEILKTLLGSPPFLVVFLGGLGPHTGKRKSWVLSGQIHADGGGVSM